MIFLVTYTYRNVKFEIKIPADSWEDAQERLEEIKKNAVISGILTGGFSVN